MKRAKAADLEDLAVSSSAAFRAIMERSEARYRAEGGLTTDEVRRVLAERRRRARVRVASRKAVARRSRG